MNMESRVVVGPIVAEPAITVFWFTGKRERLLDPETVSGRTVGALNWVIARVASAVAQRVVAGVPPPIQVPGFLCSFVAKAILKRVAVRLRLHQPPRHGLATFENGADHLAFEKDRSLLQRFLSSRISASNASAPALQNERTNRNASAANTITAATRTLCHTGFTCDASCLRRCFGVTR